MEFSKFYKNCFDIESVGPQALTRGVSARNRVSVYFRGNFSSVLKKYIYLFPFYFFKSKQTLQLIIKNLIYQYFVILYTGTTPTNSKLNKILIKSKFSLLLL